MKAPGPAVAGATGDTSPQGPGSPRRRARPAHAACPSPLWPFVADGTGNINAPTLPNDLRDTIVGIVLRESDGIPRCAARQLLRLTCRGARAFVDARVWKIAIDADGAADAPAAAASLAALAAAAATGRLPSLLRLELRVTGGGAAAAAFEDALPSLGQLPALEELQIISWGCELRAWTR
ncbi:hypothetical protein MNEG_14093 [Monoraphidium neglectum]|uniref:Uncharacterized protein n=1 Tax=Monoraphidium neglectum TaxID=145388 RepID=A0A0D2MFI8_9CHLO|nr:hypothetical protein MNEG_14093 [Monoraphidium neglectum]KIY93870.1 hypothetical protein MNEG_14093 [Monoraphidium neglectum]|eukprot:XP_013892890.1 hypothetical protein MNEG_14093 [Monoraphidium neglectum]